MIANYRDSVWPLSSHRSRKPPAFPSCPPSLAASPHNPSNCVSTLSSHSTGPPASMPSRKVMSGREGSSHQSKARRAAATRSARILQTKSVSSFPLHATQLCFMIGLTYVLQHAVVERFERAIDSIRSTIEEQGGNFVIQMRMFPVPLAFPLPPTDSYPLQPKTVSETKEHELAQLMTKVG